MGNQQTTLLNSSIPLHFVVACEVTTEGDVCVDCPSCIEFHEYGIPCSHLLRAYLEKFKCTLKDNGLNIQHFLASAIEPAYLAQNFCSAFPVGVKVICPSTYKGVEIQSPCSQPQTELPTLRGKRRVSRFPSRGESSKKGRTSGRKKGRKQGRKQKSCDTNMPVVQLFVSEENEKVSDERSSQSPNNTMPMSEILLGKETKVSDLTTLKQNVA